MVIWVKNSTPFLKLELKPANQNLAVKHTKKEKEISEEKKENWIKRLCLLMTAKRNDNQ